jgi:superfamily I DNA/RNA helicase
MDTKEMTLKAQSLESQIMALTVTNIEELKKAGDILYNVKDFIKTWDAKKKELIKPFKDGIRGIEAEFNPRIDKAKDWITYLETKMTTFQMEEMRRRQEEENKRREAELLRLEQEKEALENRAAIENSNKVLNEALKVEERQERLMAEPLKSSFTVKSEQAHTGLQMRWNYEVVDKNKVPREYCSYDAGLLRRAVNDGVREIEGVHIFQKPVITSK